MSCPLEKLAPEIRTVIYGYVLSFDTPLKHVNKMRPFVKKLTGVEPTSYSCITGSENESTTNLQPVNTSILTANKLIYTEAIAVLYEHNTILFDAHMYTTKGISSPLASDLSLATHIIVKIDDSVDPEVYDRVCSAMEMCLDTVPFIFPKLRTCNVYISMDTNPRPLTELVSLCHTLRKYDLFSEVDFNGVGSLQAFLTRLPCLKLVMQSRWTIDRWAKPEPVPPGDLTMSNVSANSLYHASRVDPQNVYAQAAKVALDFFKRYVTLPTETENVAYDGYEFWTLVDACICAIQDLER
jgi:hypothetical protein